MGSLCSVRRVSVFDSTTIECVMCACITEPLPTHMACCRAKPAGWPVCEFCAEMLESIQVPDPDSLNPAPWCSGCQLKPAVWREHPSVPVDYSICNCPHRARCFECMVSEQGVHPASDRYVGMRAVCDAN